MLCKVWLGAGSGAGIGDGLLEVGAGIQAGDAGTGVGGDACQRGADDNGIAGGGVASSAILEEETLAELL
ncbi:MAG: hypothetical protein M1347_01450 [Chloroflexi bacterium]|nr:hypothetical protein [Chloroflexota bacterium]